MRTLLAAAAWLVFLLMLAASAAVADSVLRGRLVIVSASGVSANVPSIFDAVKSDIITLVQVCHDCPLAIQSPSACLTCGDAAPPRPVAAPDTEILSGGRVPLPGPVRFDLAIPGRLYTCGRVSPDLGRTWEPLKDADGTELANSDAQPFVGPAGRVLCVNDAVLTSESSPDYTKAAIAAEWNGARWELIGPAQSAGAVIGGMKVLAATYLPTGEFLLATDKGLRSRERTSDLPCAPASLASASTGTLYLACSSASGFTMYAAPAAHELWFPVGGVGRIRAMAVGPDDRIYLVGDRLGHGNGGQWEWTAWPPAFVPQFIAAHPTAPIVAAWGEGAIVVSTDGGATLMRPKLSERVIWAAMDPTKTTSLLIVDVQGSLYELPFEAMK